MQTHKTFGLSHRMKTSQQHRVLCRGPLHTHTSLRQCSWIVRAEQQDTTSASEQPQGSNEDANSQPGPAYDPIFPKRGLFSIADPKQEVCCLPWCCFAAAVDALAVYLDANMSWQRFDTALVCPCSVSVSDLFPSPAAAAPAAVTASSSVPDR
jgi:hypothetical protein